MLRKGDWMEIRAQIERGVYQKDIAASLGVHPRTIRRAVKRGGAPSGKARRRRWSKVEPFRELIGQLLKEGVRNGKVVYR
ncbi:MAG: helix-turn-helix domain-containing protein, partial [Candidatus Eisenbacteria bacterium]|nr:helix-turn-helix domain-containing protein [Candidatus Eisenbacteria bacterium]